MKRKQRFFTALLCAVLLAAIAFPAAVLATDGERVIDEMQVLAAAELAELNQYARTVSGRYQMDVAFLLAAASYAPGETLAGYAEKCYRDQDLGADGLILAIDEDGGVWDLVPFGNATEILTEDDIYALFDAYDVEDTYYDGIEAYLSAAEAQFAAALGAETVDLARIADGETLPRFIDDQGLLTPAQSAELTAKLDAVSAGHQFDTVVLVVPALDSREARLYAADFFEQNGFGFGEDLDGAILLLATEERDFGFAAFGLGLEAFTPAGQEYLDKLVLPHLKDDRYFDAFMAYADAVDDFLNQAAAGTPYDEGNIPKIAGETLKYRLYAALLSLVLALAVAWLVTAMWKRQLITVRREDAAHVYIREGSLVLTGQKDIFLHRHVDKGRIAQNENKGGGGTFKSSSGGSSTGHSGKY